MAKKKEFELPRRDFQDVEETKSSKLENKKNPEVEIPRKDFDNVVLGKETVKISTKDKKDLTERLEKPIRLIYYVIGIVGSLVAIGFSIGYFKFDRKVDTLSTTSNSTERKVDTLTKIVQNNIIEKRYVNADKVSSNEPSSSTTTTENTIIERKTIFVDTIKVPAEKSPFNTVKNQNYKKQETQKSNAFKYTQARVESTFKTATGGSVQFVLGEDIYLETGKIKAGSTFTSFINNAGDRVHFGCKQLAGKDINLVAIDNNNNAGISYQELYPEGFKVRFRYE